MLQPPKDLRSFDSLLQIVKALRSPDGCPWDKEQTHRTLTPYAIEEAHELAEAIELGDEPEMVKELGDLLLQVALHAEIGRQENRFTIEDVLYAINEKMVRRHPHVFSDTEVKDSEEVLKNWAKLKAAEKAANPAPESRFDIPVALPALTRSSKIGNKTKGYSFDWRRWSEVMLKVDEELNELKDALTNNDKEEQKKELGDLLFSLAQLARHIGVEPEQALRETNQRFELRFFTMKKLAERRGQDFTKLSGEEMENYWTEAKVLLSTEKP